MRAWGTSGARSNRLDRAAVAGGDLPPTYRARRARWARKTSIPPDDAVASLASRSTPAGRRGRRGASAKGRSAHCKGVGELGRQARTDSLTGLANRRGWMAAWIASCSGAPLGAPSLRGAAGPRRLQGVQRRPRPPGRVDSATRGGGRRLAGSASRRRRPVPVGRRRVRCPAAGLLRRCGAGDHRSRHADTPTPQSCGAGIAEWDGAETSDELVWRADAELLSHKRARVYDDLHA